MRPPPRRSTSPPYASPKQPRLLYWSFKEPGLGASAVAPAFRILLTEARVLIHPVPPPRRRACPRRTQDSVARWNIALPLRAHRILGQAGGPHPSPRGE